LKREEFQLETNNLIDFIIRKGIIMKLVNLLLTIAILGTPPSVMATRDEDGTLRKSRARRKREIDSSAGSNTARHMKTTKVTKLKFIPQENVINTIQSESMVKKRTKSSAKEAKGWKATKAELSMVNDSEGNQYAASQSFGGANSMIKAKSDTKNIKSPDSYGTKAPKNGKFMYKKVKQVKTNPNSATTEMPYIAEYYEYKAQEVEEESQVEESILNQDLLSESVDANQGAQLSSSTEESILIPETFSAKEEVDENTEDGNEYVYYYYDYIDPITYINE
jgi:hypothetical protein